MSDPTGTQALTDQSPSVLKTTTRDKFLPFRPRLANSHRESDAARVLQRNYRGYRERRQLKGLSLTPASRWAEAVQEAQYRNLTTPRPHTPGSPGPSAHQNWLRASKVARRATGGDEEADSDSLSGNESDRQARRQAQAAERQERSEHAKTMELQYFLEMVDQQHRYGSNLRKYHAEWQRRNTNENFFYWLDYGEGKDLSLEICSRERLASMKVRYLSREERADYLVIVDEAGKLCWSKSGKRVDTGEEWKDSGKGIISTLQEKVHHDSKDKDSKGNNAGDDEESEESEESNHDTAEEPKRPGFNRHASPKSMLDHLLRKGPKKNMWIFVADTSLNLFVGLKQSGSFQHSSFLHGSRVCAAGLIKVRDGQLRLLQPRSGHYRIPASNFRAFINALKAKHVDMSLMSVPSSYATLVGMEGYSHTKKTYKDLKGKLQRTLAPKEDEKKAKHKGGM